jgi:hypothetical protein
VTAAVVVIVLGTGTAIAVNMLNGDGQGGTNGNPTNGGQTNSAEQGGPVNTTGTGGPQNTTVPPPDTGSRTGGDPGGPTRGSRGTPPESTHTRVDSGADAPPVNPRVDPDTAAARMLDLQREVIGDQKPTDSRLQAILDSARTMYGYTYLSTETRARAAYVVAYAAVSLGRSDLCLEWIGNALTLRPGFQSYVIMQQSGCSTDRRP